ncbi:MAG: ATP-binding protein [Ruthenibacterium lactatiformans]
MDEFEARAGAYISQHQMLQKGDTVIVALSGGADSMALFHFLFSVQNVWGLRLRAAHVNHGLRGAAADGDAAFVRAQCAARVPSETPLAAENGRGVGPAGTVRFFCTVGTGARREGRNGAHLLRQCRNGAGRLAWAAASRSRGIPPVRGRMCACCCGRSGRMSWLSGALGVPQTDATMIRTHMPATAPPRRAARSERAPGAAQHNAFCCRMSAVADYLEEQAGALLNRRACPELVFAGKYPDAYCAQTLLRRLRPWLVWAHRSRAPQQK